MGRGYTLLTCGEFKVLGVEVVSQVVQVLLSFVVCADSLEAWHSLLFRGGWGEGQFH
jgi:hypothetical protein